MSQNPYDKSDDFVYASLIIANNNNTDVDSEIPAKGSFQSGFPILQDASEYVCRVQRLYISEQQVPLLIPDVVLGQANPNQLVYQFVLSYFDSTNGNYTYSDPINVTYIPSSLALPTPSAPTIVQDISSTYYYVYYYQTFLDMWNACMATAYANLTAKVLLLPTPVVLPAGQEPIWYYDTTEGLKVQLTSSSVYDQPIDPAVNPTDGTLQIFFNSALKKFMNGMRYSYQPNSSTCNYTLIIAPPPTATAPVTPLVLGQQNIAELSYWTSIRTIQIRSALLPAQYELSPAPVGIYGNANTQSTNVITDIQIDSSATPVSYNTDVVFNNTDTLRVFNLTKKGPIWAIDAQIFWLDQYGRSFPLLLSYGISCEIKVEFIRKTAYYGIIKSGRI